jgi:large subunit ribosomal protein L15
MEQLNQLTGISKNKDRKRVGRGSSAGGGKTAGRGTKGQKARTGGSIPNYFEGGQTPWMMRLKKKKGFTSHRRFNIFRVNLGDLATLAPEGNFTIDALLEAKRIEPGTKVKILGTGEATRAYTVTTHFISASAQSKIEAAGGSVTILS